MTGAILKISPEKSIELRFTARRAEALENELDDSLLNGLAKSDRAGVITKYIAHGADISKEEAYDLYDEYIENGGTINDLAEVVIKALENGGFISRSAVEAAKKLRDQLLHRNAQRS